MTEKKPISITCFSDVLCIWAHIGQVRIDEIVAHHPGEVVMEYRFCSVFGDTTDKIGKGWARRGGYEGFGTHVLESASNYDHIRVHGDLWKSVQPASSTPAHLVLKAVQLVQAEKFMDMLRALRIAFFEQCLDVGRWEVLSDVLQHEGVSVNDVRDCLHSGQAHADLEADSRDRLALMVQGSPTYILNDGRQKLYGNVGYRVMEANVRELLETPAAGSASWC